MNFRSRIADWADRKISELEVDWDAFGRTKGCWSDGGHGPYLPANGYPPGSNITYDSRVGIRVSASICGPTPQWRWVPWGTYYPPITSSLMDLIPATVLLRWANA